MRPYLLVSLVGHVLVLVLGSIAAEALHDPPEAIDAISVGLAVAPEPEPEVPAQAPVQEPPPEPEEIERPAPEPVLDEAPAEDLPPEPEPTEPALDLPPPPVPAELERPAQAVVPDAVPEELEVAEEVRELVPPDPELPPPPVVEADLPELEPVQRRSPADTTRVARASAPVDEPDDPEPEAEVEELGAGRAVAAQSASDLDDGYLVRVQRKIGRRWQPTPASALGQSRVVSVVSFRIRPDGQVQAPAVSEPSGLTVFDRQALRAVMDAAPLPPLPPRFPDGVHINFRFEYVR